MSDFKLAEFTSFEGISISSEFVIGVRLCSAERFTSGHPFKLQETITQLCSFIPLRFGAYLISNLVSTMDVVKTPSHAPSKRAVVHRIQICTLKKPNPLHTNTSLMADAAQRFNYGQKNNYQT